MSGSSNCLRPNLLQFVLKLIREVEIGNLAVAISSHFFLSSLFPVQVVEVQMTVVMCVAGYIDYAGIGGRMDPTDEVPCQSKVAQMIRAELKLETVSGPGIRRHQHTSIAYKQI